MGNGHMTVSLLFASSYRTTGAYTSLESPLSFHADDFDDMMRRAREAGVTAQMITGGSLQESKEALELCVSGEHS